MLGTWNTCTKHGNEAICEKVTNAHLAHLVLMSVQMFLLLVLVNSVIDSGF